MLLKERAKKVADKKGSEKSIAVLPFLNMSNDPEQEYFSDGITEEIVNLLTPYKRSEGCRPHFIFSFQRERH
jgi:TolB-like protein